MRWHDSLGEPPGGGPTGVSGDFVGPRFVQFIIIAGGRARCLATRITSRADVDSRNLTVEVLVLKPKAVARSHIDDAHITADSLVSERFADRIPTPIPMLIDIVQIQPLEDDLTMRGGKNMVFTSLGTDHTKARGALASGVMQRSKRYPRRPTVRLTSGKFEPHLVRATSEISLQKPVGRRAAFPTALQEPSPYAASSSICRSYASASSRNSHYGNAANSAADSRLICDSMPATLLTLAWICSRPRTRQPFGQGRRPTSSSRCQTRCHTSSGA
jgi:hypothetical protein